ncbi:hypothetical protein QJS66_13275 [Kocuria rhizophila]|nr:hypothetical protein QJS66_13275 [Kocuria rhizophila]
MQELRGQFDGVLTSTAVSASTPSSRSPSTSWPRTSRTALMVGA